MPATEVTRTARRPKNRKAQIAMAAAELFCERGYHLVGVDEIAAAVGISGPAVYRHFPTKYAILVHASRELIAAALAATEPPSPADDDPDGRLDAILDGLARFAVERRSVGALYQWEHRYLTSEHRAEFRADLATLVTRIATPLRRTRPALTAGAADVLVRAALSTFGSLSTHRATVARGRAEQTLRRLGWAMLRADVTEPGPAGAPADASAVSPTAPPAPGAGPVGSATPDAGPVGSAAPGGRPAGSSGGPAGVAAAHRATDDAGVRPASRRELLLAEAIRLFHRLGYHAVSIGDIGTAAGINPSSVYRYFPSKADLLAAAYYRASERLAAMTESALSGAGDATDALHRLVDSYVAFSFEQSDLVSVYVSENNNLPDHDRHQLRKTQRLHVEEWVRLLTTVRPDLAVPEARILVHAALNVVSDLGRAVRFARGTGAEERVATLARAALHC